MADRGLPDGARVRRVVLSEHVVVLRLIGIEAEGLLRDGDGYLQGPEVLRQLGPNIQWVESYVADDKTFCVYLAKDEAIIRKHAEISGFPATKITEVRKLIDPTTEAP